MVNATMADDEIWHAAAMRRFRKAIRKLRGSYGDHPVLIETLADYLDDPARRQRLYRRAIRIAVKNNLPTWTIRLFYARLLLDDFHDGPKALVQLQRCEREITELADEYDKNSWKELMEEIVAKSSRLD